MTIGNVHPDPRGKISQDGQREHVFTIKAGERVQVMRFRNRAIADAARVELMGAITRIKLRGQS